MSRDYDDHYQVLFYQKTVTDNTVTKYRDIGNFYIIPKINSETIIL